ncbi:MAG: succinate dehydrogenase, cytochrome b556 subunit [Gammaproteobacteria bacterium]
MTTPTHRSVQSAKAPVYLQLWRMRFPPTAIASILHRISGVVLFLSLPLLALVLEDLLAGGDLAGWRAPLWSALWLLVMWAWTHHVFAGIRVLLADFHWAMDAAAARKTAWLVIVASPVIAFGLWWGLL